MKRGARGSGTGINLHPRSLTGSGDQAIWLILLGPFVAAAKGFTAAGQRRVLTGLRCVCDSSTSYCELRTLPKLMTDQEPTDAVPTDDPRPDGLRSADSLVLVNT
ncbi:MAG: hypothetical protein WBV06_13065, partial [Acidimicrobiia bacterium]